MLRLSRWAIVLAISLLSQPVFAGIALNTTRVIIEGGKNEASFGVRNMGDDILVQSWLESEGSSTPVQHFALTPQLVRVKAESEQIIRILYEGQGAAPDKETMFWLNVQEIPQRNLKDGGFQIAVLQRIKVFYRPPGLPGKMNEAIRKLEWSFNGNAVQISNASPLHITLVNLNVDGKRHGEPLLIGPHQTYTLGSQKNDGIRPTPSSAITYAAVTDYGAQDGFRLTLSADKPVKGEYTAATRTR